MGLVGLQVAAEEEVVEPVAIEMEAGAIVAAEAVCQVVVILVGVGPGAAILKAASTRQAAKSWLQCRCCHQAH